MICANRKEEANLADLCAICSTRPFSRFACDAISSALNKPAIVSINKKRTGRGNMEDISSA